MLTAKVTFSTNKKTKRLTAKVNDSIVGEVYKSRLYTNCWVSKIGCVEGKNWTVFRHRADAVQNLVKSL